MSLQQKTDLRAEVASLLTLASEAHARYEEEELGGEYDSEWARWYAQYLLQKGIERTLREVGQGALCEDLEGWLSRADRSHRANAPGERWEEYYAALLVEGD